MNSNCCQDWGMPQTVRVRGQGWAPEAGGDRCWHQSPGSAGSLPRMCVSSCPAGFFGDNGARRCRRCHKGCERCVGRGPSQCTACKRNLYHHPEMGTCVLLCPPGFYAEERKDPYHLQVAALGCAGVASILSAMGGELTLILEYWL